MNGPEARELLSLYYQVKGLPEADADHMVNHIARDPEQMLRALAGERPTRGLLRASAREDGVPGFVGNDYLEDEEFWAKVEWAAATARTFAGRIRSGDVRHDPLGLDVGPRETNGNRTERGRCPSWCQLAPLCRVARR